VSNQKPQKSFTLSPMPKIGSLIRSHFFSGMLVALPFAVIFWMATYILNTLWNLHKILPIEWQPEFWLADPTQAYLFNALIVVGLSLVLVLLVSALGWVSTQYLGRKFLHFLSEVIQHIPVLRSVHSALDQLLRTLASGGGQQFNRVVYVEYPRKGVWVIAFVTGPVRGGQLPPHHVNVYVPTTPNPTSGFHLMVHESEIKESGMKVEEAFKTILSLGIAQSSEKLPS